MFGAPKAVRRIVAGALIASAILLRPSASSALDSVTLITDFGYNGRHAYFFDALEKGYYRDVGLEVKIVRGQGSVDAIRQVGAGNAMFGFADAGTLILARANDQILVKLPSPNSRRFPASHWVKSTRRASKPPSTWSRAPSSLRRLSQRPTCTCKDSYRSSSRNTDATVCAPRASPRHSS